MTATIPPWFCLIDKVYFWASLRSCCSFGNELIFMGWTEGCAVVTVFVFAEADGFAQAVFLRLHDDLSGLRYHFFYAMH